MSRDALPLTGVRVLLVEDHYILAAGLAKTLRALGASVLGPAGTLAQASALAGRLAPAVL